MKKLMNEVSPSDILKPTLVLFTKCCSFCFFILSIFIFSSVVFAATIFVPGDYDTIQDAINASSTGDTVSVAEGTYYENILFPGNTTNITLVSENGPESTVIDGGNNGSVVTFAAGINATLDGFTITNGSTSENGGGIRIGSSSSPTIANCIITDNEAFAGGGISCGDSSEPFITNSIIQNNSVTGDNDQSNGGGIHASPAASPTITNCIIKDNTSDWNGGGLAFNTADEPLIVNCIFSNNTAAVNGGAITFKNSAPIITNCTFSNNSASSPGGAIACSNPLPGTAVSNSILWGDSPAEITCDANTISVTYSDIQGGGMGPGNPGIPGETTWPGTGNINADPKFVDEENGDFHLLNDSPCIDAGDNSALALPSTDIDGDDRKIDDPGVADTGNGTPPIVDMGAFEYNGNSEHPLEWVTKVKFSGSGGGCFIATAAYGSYWEPHVMTLRQFRDEYLLTNKLGTNFVEAYYKYSPPLADYIAEYDGLRTAVRIGLAPLVGFSWLAIKFGIFTAMVILLSILTLTISGTCLMSKSKEIN
ncbi:MAG: right-handed parallel beta-helix repeat-containing protein [Desulfobulbaceae bacterium]|nr:right-handed parallel beta-helix repeat-containing protein [Desulfobulbaceae bacterium]